MQISQHLNVWLKTFSKAVRERDFATGKTLFDNKVTSFGTVYFRADNLVELAERQWRAVWPNTRGFKFDYASAMAIETKELAIITIGWRSTGFDKNKQPVARQGRATIVLKKSVAGWKAVHTHFSITPHSTYDPVFRHARPR